MQTVRYKIHRPRLIPSRRPHRRLVTMRRTHMPGGAARGTAAASPGSTAGIPAWGSHGSLPA